MVFSQKIPIFRGFFEVGPCFPRSGGGKTGVLATLNLI
jgi:hypothetical protein